MAMRFEAKLIIPAAALVGLAGCAPVDPGLGEALRYDMAVQTVNPDPVYPEDGAQPGDSGVRGAEAVKAYRKGETKALRIESSTSGSGGGGSGPQ
jgi:type IV pilus biogenesis protein CpaD/CtpE